MGSRLKEKQALTKVPTVLASVLDVPEGEVLVEPADEPDFDVFIRATRHIFALAVLSNASIGLLADRTERLVAAVIQLRRKVVPLVAVPFMTEIGRRTCAEAKVSWFDLSGNAHIVAPGLRIIVDGRPNRFRSPGRPASIFAPKSARVVRWLLENECSVLTQREMARATDMTEAFVSRIVARLEHESYIVRQRTGGIRVRNPQLLLDAWRSEYRFDKHTLVQGHVAARSGDALARFVGDTLGAASIEHAATGLAAAWQMTHFAAFRIATFFLADTPNSELRSKLGFREETRGANLWLVIPNDAGVFHGARMWDNLHCVHPVQAYVDLKAHPERAEEAAGRLRSERLTWKLHG